MTYHRQRGGRNQYSTRRATNLKPPGSRRTQADGRKRQRQAERRMAEAIDAGERARIKALLDAGRKEHPA